MPDNTNQPTAQTDTTTPPPAPAPAPVGPKKPPKQNDTNKPIIDGATN